MKNLIIIIASFIFSIPLFASYESNIVSLELENDMMNGCIKSSSAHWSFSDGLCECDEGYTNIGLELLYSKYYKIACYPDDEVDIVKITYIDKSKNLYVRFMGDYTGLFVAKINEDCPLNISDGSLKLSGYYRNSGIKGGKYGYLIQSGQQCNLSSINKITDEMMISWKKEYIKDLGKKLRLERDKNKKKIIIEEYLRKYEELKTPQGLVKNTMYDYFIALAQGRMK